MDLLTTDLLILTGVYLLQRWRAGAVTPAAAPPVRV